MRRSPFHVYGDLRASSFSTINQYTIQLLEFDCFLILQYISATPGVQGAYMHQYPPMQTAPVSLLYCSLIQLFIQDIQLLPGGHLTVYLS